MSQARCFLLPALFFLPLCAWAQTTIPQEYDKLIQQRGEVVAFGADGFGDKVELSNGALEIVQVDVDLPGNNSLPVRVARRFVPGNKHAVGHFGVWNLDVPYVHGVFGYHAYNPQGWTVNQVTADMYKRCSRYGPPLTLVFQQIGVFEPDEYWHGNFLHMPGQGDEELLLASGHAPNDGNTYPVVTKSGAAVRCVALAPTSEAGSQGEGFEVVAADGTVYTLNQMVSRTEENISKPIGQRALRTSPSLTTASSVIQPLGAVNFGLPRREVLLYPTRITDRFGNSVTYSWSTTNPWQLLNISASDGRQIVFTYASSTGLQVTSISDGARTWTYSGGSDAYTVTLPDGSRWVSNLAALFEFKLNPTGDGCFQSPGYAGTGAPVTGTITSPSGATATFSMQPVRIGRSWVNPQCVFNDLEPIYAMVPGEYFTFALVGKTVTGPGMPTSALSWDYSYGPANSCWVQGGSPLCSASSPTTRTVSVTDPAGQVVRYTFGNVAYGNDGLLLKTEHGWTGSSAQRTVDIVYADSNAAPYAPFYGGTPRGRGDTRLSSEKVPQRRVVTTQQGRTFTWEVAADCSGVPYCFDTFARPTKVVQTSSP